MPRQAAKCIYFFLRIPLLARAIQSPISPNPLVHGYAVRFLNETPKVLIKRRLSFNCILTTAFGLILKIVYKVYFKPLITQTKLPT